MKETDEIKELFQKELGNFSGKVDPTMWSAIQSHIGSTAATSTGAAAGISASVKIAASVVAAAVIAGATVFFISETDTSEVINSQIVDTPERIEQIEDTNSIQSNSDSIRNNSDEALRVIPQQTIELPEVKNVSEEIIWNATDQQKEIAANFEKIEVQDNIDKVDPIVPIDKPQQMSSAGSNGNVVESKNVQELYEPLLEVDFQQVSNQQIRLAIHVEGVTKFWTEVSDGAYYVGERVEHWLESAGNHVITVYAETKEGLLQESFNVTVELTGKIDHLPNVFTPDGDGNNDLFYLNTEGISSFQVTIFNTKQEVVFESNDVHFEWNGIDRRTQQKVPAGNYYYIIIASDSAGNIINKHQTLSVIY